MFLSIETGDTLVKPFRDFLYEALLASVPDQDPTPELRRLVIASARFAALRRQVRAGATVHIILKIVVAWTNACATLTA
ncbi:MAG: hypothetical protein EA383_04455 [Spirochaetaceae bacterium]|nr:MAG: hypothetical protein EA383_04455 [Spirochaetaceae bacterium]